MTQNFIDRAILVRENTIVLERDYTEGQATLGTMHFPDGTTLETLELPWLDNQTSISCIPEGTYALGLRTSGVVSRTSRGKYKQGWEVQNVPNRQYIMVHVGNTVNDVEGCILVGMVRGVLNKELAVLSSQFAFEDFMEAMTAHDEWELIITEKPKDDEGH